MASGHTLVLGIAFLMFIGGFGLIAIDYYYDTNILDNFDKITVSAVIGLIGLILLVKIIKSYGMFMQFTKHHLIGLGILFVFVFAYAYSQGWLEWLF